MKEFFGGLGKATGPVGTDIIEKDYHLHRLLRRISENERLRDILVFKGGTCLVKAYTGYYRFSEDIDFTRRQDAVWREETGGRAERRCSSEITVLLKELKNISDSLGLRFSGDKSMDTARGGDVDIRGGGKMFDAWLRYRSEALGVPAKMKVQVNLMDIIEFPVAEVSLKSFVSGSDLEGLRPLYPGPCDEYGQVVVFPCYDPREIFTEKCRAAMTRIVYKPRDVLDIYMMEKRFGFTIAEYRDSIVRKTEYMLEMYSKYRESFETMDFPEVHVFTDAEEKLLLGRVPSDFGHEASRIHGQLRSLRQEIMSR